ncbi:MAG: hypothetical protein ACK55Z_15770 [bacterium]
MLSTISISMSVVCLVAALTTQTQVALRALTSFPKWRDVIDVFTLAIYTGFVVHASCTLALDLIFSLAAGFL